MIIPFSPPDITEQEILEVADALRSGWITTGPRTKALEKEVAALCHTDKAVCLGSATACLESVLRLLGIGPGDEVITTAYTYTASASVVCHVGATLRLVDTQKDSLEMDYDQLAATINEHTKAVIPVDIAGIPCDYDQVLAVVDAKRHLFRPANDLQKAIGRVAVTADAAHALGASRGGKMTGAMADFSSFSFHATKNLTTAEGGALTWRPLTGIDDEWIYKQFQLLSLHGQSKDALEKTQKGGWEYDIVSPAYKCNMTDLAAAVGLAQIRRYPAMLEKRRRLIETYDAALKGEDVQVLRHYTDAYTSSGHLYMVRLNGRSLEARNEVIERMAQQGVATNVHYKPLPMMTAYRRLGFDIADYPHAYALFQNEITLPLYSRLNDEQVAYLLKTFKETIR
ncbi:dTDP-4-amino-4,6-dideoxygalactose transaminase [Prevotella aff. ruminicola Tc2-24]|uniref:dTDP-4-amino-4,6-dideoxygalactose transaminase n=2 Tax=Prevotella aff. ruminicola Tc2-24 TaxID=81582 RepID=A0A1I0PQU5_9BACT|nr:dTDP-4-amino-4,6-dideoxygalactose transaminase [Prevotella aff. ruminicola Tc2-24]